MYDDFSGVDRRVREFLAAELPAGKEIFITENALAGRFGMTRSAARRQLLALEGEGALHCTPRGYRRVDYRDTPLEIVYELRRTVEQSAARLAAERAERRDIVELTLLVEELEEALEAGDAELYDRLDVEFHQALVAASHDALLEKVAAFLLWTAGTTGGAERDPELERRGQQFHREILAAVRRKDAAAAEKLIAGHVKIRR